MHEIEFQERIPYRFQDISLLKRALTHSSFANECQNEKVKDNERLEFLGDAVLEIAVSDYLYRNYPDWTEGELSKRRVAIVCEPTLDLCAKALGLSEFLYMGRGEERTGGRKRASIVSDAMEAVIGAVYLDGGFEQARAYIEKVILEEVKDKPLYHDCKTALQELIQGSSKKKIDYRSAGSKGPDHNKTFMVDLFIGEEKIASASGHTKKAAEQQAAYDALLKLEK
jgi:ribonuclease III